MKFCINIILNKIKTIEIIFLKCNLSFFCYLHLFSLSLLFHINHQYSCHLATWNTMRFHCHKNILWNIMNSKWLIILITKVLPLIGNAIWNKFLQTGVRQKVIMLHKNIIFKILSSFIVEMKQKYFLSIRTVAF